MSYVIRLQVIIEVEESGFKKVAIYSQFKVISFPPLISSKSLSVVL